jgi:hypothetical protein
MRMKKLKTIKTLLRRNRMQEAEMQYDVLKRLHEKLTQFVNAVCENTYLSCGIN